MARRLRIVCAGIILAVAGFFATAPQPKNKSAEAARDISIRKLLTEKYGDAAQRVRILYGGSMKPDNAPELLRQPDIDGGLIGGASLVAEDFLAICRAAERKE